MAKKSPRAVRSGPTPALPPLRWSRNVTGELRAASGRFGLKEDEREPLPRWDDLARALFGRQPALPLVLAARTDRRRPR